MLNNYKMSFNFSSISVNDLDNFTICKPTDNGTLSASRDKQDRFALDYVFHRKRNGYYVDVGASDGVTESNTYLMEKFYDWKGICCECEPRNVQKLCINRTCHISGSPVFNKTGVLVPFSMFNSTRATTQHLSGISGLSTYTNNDIKVVTLSTISLMDCLKQFDAPPVIDYMSLDTEGAEYEILREFDFTKYTFNYIALEHNSQEPKRTLIRQLMEKNGYAWVRAIMADDDYINIQFAKENGIKYPV